MNSAFSNEMLYLEQTINNISSVFSSCRKYRHSLSYELTGEGRTKTLVVIARSPVCEEKDGFDVIISKTKAPLFSAFKDAKKIIIVSLFGIRTTSVEETASIIKLDGAEIAIGKENDTYLNAIVSKADYVVVAWGGCGKIPKKVFDGRIYKVLNNNLDPLSSCYINSKKGKKRYPLHPFFWTKNDIFQKITTKEILL